MDIYVKHHFFVNKPYAYAVRYEDLLDALAGSKAAVFLDPGQTHFERLFFQKDGSCLGKNIVRYRSEDSLKRARKADGILFKISHEWLANQANLFWKNPEWGNELLTVIYSLCVELNTAKYDSTMQPWYSARNMLHALTDMMLKRFHCVNGRFRGKYRSIELFYLGVRNLETKIQRIHSAHAQRRDDLSYKPGVDPEDCSKDSFHQKFLRLTGLIQKVEHLGAFVDLVQTKDFEAFCTIFSSQILCVSIHMPWEKTLSLVQYDLQAALSDTASSERWFSQQLIRTGIQVSKKAEGLIEMITKALSYITPFDLFGIPKECFMSVKPKDQLIVSDENAREAVPPFSSNKFIFFRLVGCESESERMSTHDGRLSGDCLDLLDVYRSSGRMETAVLLEFFYRLLSLFETFNKKYTYFYMFKELLDEFRRESFCERIVESASFPSGTPKPTEKLYQSGNKLFYSVYAPLHDALVWNSLHRDKERSYPGGYYSSSITHDVRYLSFENFCDLCTSFVFFSASTAAQTALHVSATACFSRSHGRLARWLNMHRYASYVSSLTSAFAFHVYGNQELFPYVVFVRDFFRCDEQEGRLHSLSDHIWQEGNVSNSQVYGRASWTIALTGVAYAAITGMGLFVWLTSLSPGCSIYSWCFLLCPALPLFLFPAAYLMNRHSERKSTFITWAKLVTYIKQNNEFFIVSSNKKKASIWARLRFRLGISSRGKK